MKKALALIACSLLATHLAAEVGEFSWPEGAEGAVVLTYDDGLDSHLDFVAPDLEATGLRGTFYVTGSSESVKNRMEEWRELARRGHELGNHTLFHPCLGVADGEPREWVQPERDLRNYTVRQMLDELRTASTLLASLDDRTERSYAYTCGDELAGEDSYVAELATLFPSARVAGDTIVSDPQSLDLHRVPSWAVIGTSAQEMIIFVEKAAETGGLAVFMFHGVGGDYLTVSHPEHRQLLEYLAANRHRLWTDTFLEVLNHVREERHDLE